MMLLLMLLWIVVMRGGKGEENEGRGEGILLMGGEESEFLCWC